MSSFSNVFASTNNSSSHISSEEKYGEVIEYINNEDPQTLPDTSYEEPKNRLFVTEEFAKSLVDDGTIRPFYGESEKSTVKKTEYYTKTTTPTGQNAGGTRFSTGGVFYVNKKGGPNVSFSVGTSWGRYLIVCL
ncbi:hypothetical protein [Bacillus andreraoultii]|uniref:hypothetical protein n=1 Tax=Bacillus andreraoultii TaxID=1499685 RepID=UPI00053AA961|nr:hypothetical protein [Bacillus andreraoultii]